MDCFAALAMTWIEFRVLATYFVRGMHFVCPHEGTRAQGRPGACRTRGLVCDMRNKSCAHEHTGSAEASRPSLRNGFTAYLVLFPERTALLPPSPAIGFRLSRT